MAARYWVGGNGTWDGTAGTKWALTAGGAGGQAVPTSADDVFFTTSNTITVSGSRVCKSLNCTGFTGTLTGTLTPVLTISGSMTLVSGMTFNTTAGPSLIFDASGTITTAGKTVRAVSFTGTSATYTMADALTSNATVTLTSGTLDLGTYTFTCSIFSSSNSNTREITFGSGSKISITGSSATILSLATTTGLTITGTPFFQSTYTGNTGQRTFSISNTAGSVSFNVSTAGSSGLVIGSTATDIVALGGLFQNFDLTGFVATLLASTRSISGDFTLPSSGGSFSGGTGVTTFAGTGTITSNGRTLDFPITINSPGGTVTLAGALTLGSVRTLNLTAGTFNAVTYNVSCGLFNSSNTNTRTLALGSGTWTIQSGSSTTGWICSTSTNMTVTGSGTISMTSSGAKAFAGGDLTWPTLQNAGTGALTISGNNTFTTLSNSVQPTTFTFTAGSTQTVTNFNINGTAGNLVAINSSTAGSQATLSKASGTVSVSYLSIQDSNATGGASWEAFTSNGNVNNGNNTGWNFGAVVSETGNFLMFFN